MDCTRQVIYRTVVVCGFLSILTERNGALPMQDSANKVAKILKYGTASEVDQEINSTFPEILRSKVSPYEYLRLRGLNVSGLDIISFLFRNNRTAQRMRRSYLEPVMLSKASCPVTWNVNFEKGRKPAQIMFASCNGQGTVCKSRDDNFACEEIKITNHVYRFLGNDGNGKLVYRRERMTIPVACTCTA
ncbi:uncharacterized protein LOC135695196 [Rhopilema esculentum]|uniref:uncharacterized protein LOC135695196 n=1 Tax=Rhopilema esculentum TaxID=499914 RepID=UPI0031D20212